VIAYTYWAFHHLAQLALTVGFWNLVPIMMLMGAGLPCVFVTLSTVSLRSVRREDITAATSLYTLARSVGGNLGYALVATLLERFAVVHHAYLSVHISGLNTTYPGYATALAARLAHQTGDPVAAQRQALALVEALVQRQAAMLAYNDVARVFGVLFLCTLPLLWLFPRRHSVQSGRPSARH
jgi:MFS transporter, DHA2 family, multidrug resistance protein